MVDQKQNFESMTFNELKLFAKRKGLKVFKNTNKPKLINFFREYEQYKNDFKNKLMNIKEVPKKFLTYELYENAAIRGGIEILKVIPLKFRKLCLKLMRLN